MTLSGSGNVGSSSGNDSGLFSGAQTLQGAGGSFGGGDFVQDPNTNGVWDNADSASTKFGTVLQSAGYGIAAVGDFKRGGAGGAVSGTGDVLMAVAPFTGPAAPYIMAAGMAMKFVGGFLGDKQTQRDKRGKLIDETLKENAFIPTPSINLTETTSGEFLGTDSMGRIRTSQISHININIKAFDSKDVMAHAHDIATATRYAVQLGHPLKNEIQTAVGV
jgi:hypothetical protein